MQLGGIALHLEQLERGDVIPDKIFIVWSSGILESIITSQLHNHPSHDAQQ